MLLSNNHDCLLFFFENSFYFENIQAYTNVVRISYEPLSSTNLHHSASESLAVVSVALPFFFNLCFSNDFVACFLFVHSEHLVVDRQGFLCDSGAILSIV